MRLIDDIMEAELYQLIPNNLTKNASGEYMEYDDIEKPVFVAPVRSDDDESDPDELDYEEELYKKDMYENTKDLLINESGIFHVLSELKSFVDMDDMDDDEFLDLRLCDIMGLTPSQMKFLEFGHADLWDIHDLFDILLNAKDFPSPEIRCKVANVYAIYRFYIGKKERRDYYTNIIRHHTTEDSINLIKLHGDYERMLNTFNVWKSEDGFTPEFDYQECPKVNHLKDMHDKAAREYRKEYTKREQKDKIDEKIKERWKSRDYNRFLYKNNDFSVIGVKDSEDLYREGEVLNHCVYQYLSDFANGVTNLYFIRHNDELDTPYFTVEVKTKESNMQATQYELTQCYGYGDSVDKTPKLYNFIKEWCSNKKIRAACIL